MSWSSNPGLKGARRRWIVLSVLALLGGLVAVLGAFLLWGTGGALLVGGGLTFEFLTRADLL